MESLKPQDVLVVLKLCAIASASDGASEPKRPPMAVLGTELGLSSSEVHAAIWRGRASGLLQVGTRFMFTPSSTRVKTKLPPQELRDAPRPVVARSPRIKYLKAPQERINVTGVIEFLVHGLKYVFPPNRGGMTRGIATSYAAAPLNGFIARGEEPIPVWPFAEGNERGIEFEPLYRTVPFAALRDPALYELLAIADALREGRARERKIAEEQLRLRLSDIEWPMKIASF
jgi:hypothetical protein